MTLTFAPMRILFHIAFSAFVWAAMPAFAATDEPAPVVPLPSFKELEQMKAVVGNVRVNVQNIFDLADPKEDNFLFGMANRLHITTQSIVIERALLFKTGQRVSVSAIDETERLLRSNRYLYDAQIKPVALHDGVVDIEVQTRDTWTIDATGSVSRSGGANTTAFGIKEYNLLGTGMRLNLARTSNTDRHGSEFELSYAQAFDGWTRLNYLQGHYNDGSHRLASVVRPFYALDTRWAAGITWDKQERIDSIYNAGDTVAGYRHNVRSGEAFAGWSPGLVDGWTQRYSVGSYLQDDRYRVAPDRIAPSPTPIDHEVRSLFLRFELIEDRFVKLRNRDQIARTEFVALGFSSRVQLMRSQEAWGASQSAWLYSASVSNGISFPWKHDLLATASAERRIASTGLPLTQMGARLRYYAPQSTHMAFYASLAGDRIGSGGEAPDQLLLGGDNGLRGYPLRYQSGERRILATVEQRVYSDWYPFRLFRVGGAVFADYGRAWRGVNQNSVNGGGLSDVGVGLRIALDRAAFANVLHLDVAAPLNRVPGIKPLQYLVKTELTF